MGPYGHVWDPIGSQPHRIAQVGSELENSRVQPEPNHQLWGCMGSYGDVWDPMGSCGVLWGHRAIGLLRLDQTLKPIGFNYNPTALPSLWGPVGLYGVLWDCMGSYGVA